MEDIVEREGRAVIVDLVGKGRRRRTVAVPYWVKQSVNQWTAAAGITKGPLLRPVSKSGKLGKTAFGDWSVWSVVERCAKEIGVKNFGPFTRLETARPLCIEDRDDGLGNELAQGECRGGSRWSSSDDGGRLAFSFVVHPGAQVDPPKAEESLIIAKSGMSVFLVLKYRAHDHRQTHTQTMKNPFAGT